MMLYTDTFCQNTTYRKEFGGKYDFMDSKKMTLSWFKGVVSNIVPGSSHNQNIRHSVCTSFFEL